MFNKCIAPLAAVSAFLLAPIGPAGAQNLITVTGAVDHPNRGAYSADVDKFFGFHEITFDTAHAFDMAALTALPQQTITTDFAMGGPMQTFEGPALADVLATAGVAGGATVWMQALDGYAVEAPVSELIAKGAVLALRRNGQAMRLGDFGPAQLVFPRGTMAGLDDMNDDLWIWSIFHIKAQ